MCGSKISRTNLASMHRPKACKKFSSSVAPTRCKSSCKRRKTSPAWCTRGEAFTSTRRPASWRAEVRDRSRWSSRSVNVRHFKTATCSRTWSLCNTIQSSSRRATLPSKSSATLESREASPSVQTSKPESQGEFSDTSKLITKCSNTKYFFHTTQKDPLMAHELHLHHLTHQPSRHINAPNETQPHPTHTKSLSLHTMKQQPAKMMSRKNVRLSMSCNTR